VPGDPSLDDLSRIRPDRYRVTKDRIGRELLVFDVASDTDFDWLESEIRRTGYYEHDGVWTLGIDNDKRVMAEVVASFHPRRVLELGCASGAVLMGLAERDIDVTGIDVSELARSNAPDLVRDRIVLGDVLDAPVRGPFDLVVGLDIFEHLNPNRIDAYLARVDELLAPGGWLVANIPAFGEDPVFGEVHPDFLVDDHELHRTIQVDERGYPINGHLVWGTWHWWQDHVEATGMHRAVVVEEALQARYGDYWRAHYPARGSLFVFRKGADYGAEGTLAEEIRRLPSAWLAEFARPPAPETPCSDRSAPAT
jgi:SAM-dependent methyltransferase